MNQQYIKELSDAELLEKLQPFLDEKYKTLEKTLLQKMIRAGRNSLQQLGEVNQILTVFDEVVCEEEQKSIQSKLQKPEIQQVLKYLREQIQSAEKWDEMAFKLAMKNTQNQTAVKGKELWMPVRLALTSKEQGPECL